MNVETCHQCKNWKECKAWVWMQCKETWVWMQDLSRMQELSRIQDLSKSIGASRQSSFKNNFGLNARTPVWMEDWSWMWRRVINARIEKNARLECERKAWVWMQDLCEIRDMNAEACHQCQYWKECKAWVWMQDLSRMQELLRMRDLSNWKDCNFTKERTQPAADRLFSASWFPFGYFFQKQSRFACVDSHTDAWTSPRNARNQRRTGFSPLHGSRSVTFFKKNLDLHAWTNIRMRELH